MEALLSDIKKFCDELLVPEKFKDWSFNGIQVEGRQSVKKVVTGVTANEELFLRARNAHADLVITHHGLYWKGGDPRLVGVLGNRIKQLGNLSLMAYHLPLDAHPLIGNNALLVKTLGGSVQNFIKDSETPDVAAVGKFETPQSVATLKVLLESLVAHNVLVMGPSDVNITDFVVCSGGGGFLLEESLEGHKVLITGEVHEQHFHLARERGITTFVCGHHATECCGIMALGHCIAEKFSIEHEFINVVSPL